MPVLSLHTIAPIMPQHKEHFELQREPYGGSNAGTKVRQERRFKKTHFLEQVHYKNVWGYASGLMDIDFCMPLLLDAFMHF